MGTRVEPPVLGRECAVWDPPAETPLFIWAMFYDVKLGTNPAAVPAPNWHLFKCQQHPSSVCTWVYENLAFGWEIFLQMQWMTSLCTLNDLLLPKNLYFTDTSIVTPWPEYHVFTNEFWRPLLAFGWNGHCVIFWSDPFVLLPTLFGLDHIEDLMMEFFTDDADNIYVKYCSLRYGINFKFKILR